MGTHCHLQSCQSRMMKCIALLLIQVTSLTEIGLQLSLSQLASFAIEIDQWLLIIKISYLYALKANAGQSDTL